MVEASNLGFPRIGARRELKLKLVEPYWRGDISQDELLNGVKELKEKNWQAQLDKGIRHIPSNDFSLYDQVLDMICLLGAVPKRYNFSGGNVDLDTYFAMARGSQKDDIDVTAMEMTKWFDTNYHYIVPEFEENQVFSLSSTKIFDEFNHARDLGIATKPIILGPLSFLLSGKPQGDFDPLDLLDNLLPVYKEILMKFSQTNAKWIQIDEPYLVTDLDDKTREAYVRAYKDLMGVKSGLNVLVTTYFGELGENLDTALALGADGLHIDLVRGKDQLDSVLSKVDDKLILSLGVVDGRNVWINNFEQSYGLLKKASDKVGSDRIIVAPSCSLLHSPIDLDLEVKLDSELKSWMSYAKQKLDEVVILANAIDKEETLSSPEWYKNISSIKSRDKSKRIHDQDVKSRFESITKDMLDRDSAFAKRKESQKVLGLPLFPTTTIGSFPQTKEVRQMRAKFKKGELNQEDYDVYLKDEIKKCVKVQEKIDIDVLVHGEFERNDMVEYFGEQLNGFAFSQNGWVQSYGSRCVKPPIIYGDVSRPNAMTVDWTAYAQEQTTKLMKGMLTGPVTILQWSFVRDDQPREVTCKQIGLAIRDEVVDLEKAGIKIIQIDEPALREGLPLRRKDWDAYLKWAVDSFRLSAAGVKDETQIHTHMCYSEFNDIIQSIADLDADVISIETSRSNMELLGAFADFKYPNDIGPGVYDIHSPRVPSASEMEDLLTKALLVLKPEQIWVNPDCGLKTRNWEETVDALVEMVKAAHKIREAAKVTS